MARRSGVFFGWRVVSAALVLAVLGWGMGFYGPPIYLQAIRERRGWSVGLISTAVTLHFVVGAVVVANLPRLHARIGVPFATKAGAIFFSVGVLGWASAAAPWQLFVATLFSGAGWAATGAAAVNAIVSPWFVRTRPAALSMAYNGASIGGVVFLLFRGVVLFGAGIGNATSLPPLIAPVEFSEDRVPCVVALKVAVVQAAHAFAPATFGLVKEFSAPQ